MRAARLLSPTPRPTPRPVRRAVHARSISNPAYFDSIVPPKVRESKLIPVKEGLWVVSQPFLWPGVLDPRLHMAVARLGDGSLLVSGPVAPTPQCLEMLSECGSTVSHIVISNNAWEHSVFAPAMAAAFPDARIWTVPGALDGRPGFFYVQQDADARALKDTGRVLELSEDEPHPEWPTGFQVALVQDAGSVANLTEAALYIEAAKAVCFADMTYAVLDRPDPLYTSGPPQAAALFGVWRRVGSILTWLMLLPGLGNNDNRERLTRWLQRIWQWDLDTVLAAHLEPSVANGRLEIARAFGLLKVPELQEYLQEQERLGLADVPAAARELAGAGSGQEALRV